MSRSRPQFRTARRPLSVLMALAVMTALMVLPISPAGATTAITGDTFSATTNGGTFSEVPSPLGGSSFSYTGTAAALNAPGGGGEYQPWVLGNHAPTLSQSVTDAGDFDLVAAFDSTPAARFQLQGIIIADASNNFLRFDVHHDGTGMRCFGGEPSSADSADHVAFDVSISTGKAAFLRVVRTGNTFEAFVSETGVGGTYTSCGSLTRAMTITDVGVFGGNARPASGEAVPAYSALVDYFGPFVAPDSLPSQTESDVTDPVISNEAVTVSNTAVTFNFDVSEPATGTAQVLSHGSVVTSTIPVAFHGGTITGLPADTDLTLRLSVTDTAGRTDTKDVPFKTSGSATAPVIDVFYGPQQSFGSPGTTQRWINILGNVSDPQDNLQTLTYTLNGGASKTLSVGPDLRRLDTPGDFNIDILRSDLQVGTNTVVITATDTTAEVTQTTVQIQYSDTETWPVAYGIDWSAVSDLTQAVDVVDGKWQISGGTLLTPTVAGYDRLVAVGDSSWTDYEISFPFTVSSFTTDADDPESNGPGVGVFLRWNGHNDTVAPGSQPQQGFLPDGTNPTPIGGILWWRDPAGSPPAGLRIQDENATEQALDTGFTLTLGTTYEMRAQVIGSVYRFKVWEQGTAEPGTWSLSFDTGTGGDNPASGSAVIVAHEATVNFGDVIVTPVGSSAAADPTITPSGGAINSGATIEISSSTPGAVIHYTTDGSTPTPLSPVYSTGVTLNGDATVKAIAYAAGKNPSGVTSTSFNVNSVPTVSAGSDTTALLGDALSLSGSASDTDGPSAVSVTWTKISGPGSVSFGSATTAATTATFSALGTYVLRLSATDGLATVTDDVTVSVQKKNGYWIVDAAGKVTQFGPVAHHGDLSGTALSSPVTAIGSNPEKDGYWLVQRDGGVAEFGAAADFGDLPGLGITPAFDIVGMAATRTGNGYYLLGKDGGIFSFGDANFYGSTGAIVLDQPVVAMAAHPTGEGYWFVAKDGGIFTYGPDATFNGSLPQFVPFDQLAAPVVGMAATATGKGYWLVAADGGMFAFGDAQFYGSIPGVLPPGTTLNSPIVGMVATSSGKGYWLVAEDGGVFAFGDAPFFGSGAGSGGQVVGLTG